MEKKQIRMRRIKIHPETLLQAWEEGTIWKVAQGIPKGSVIKGWTVDPHNQELNLFVEHSSFEAIDLKDVAPGIDVQFHKVTLVE